MESLHLDKELHDLQVLECSEKCLQEFSRTMYNELENSEGELLIKIPESCYTLMDEQKVIKIGVETKVVKPKHVRWL